MSKYTTEVRFICETLAGYDESQGLGEVNKIIETARPKVFSFDYPIFDSAYKGVLETKILKHYYTREIGLETVGLWKLKLETLMNEIMPYYNELYNSTLLKYNPFYDVDITRDHKGKGTGVTDSASQMVDESATERSGETNVNTWDYYSDTPQGTVGNLADLTYLTDARHITNDTETQDSTDYAGTRNTDSSVNVNTTDEYIEHVVGKQGVASYSKLLMDFRKTFINIDLMIINDLNELFMNLW